MKMIWEKVIFFHFGIFPKLCISPVSNWLYNLKCDWNLQQQKESINIILAFQLETIPFLFFWANNDNKRNKNEIVSAFILFVLSTFCLVLQRL